MAHLTVACSSIHQWPGNRALGESLSIQLSVRIATVNQGAVNLQVCIRSRINWILRQPAYATADLNVVRLRITTDLQVQNYPRVMTVHSRIWTTLDIHRINKLACYPVIVKLKLWSECTSLAAA